MELEKLDEDTTKQYLRNDQHITRPEIVDAIWEISHGFPRYFDELSAKLHGAADPNADVVRYFLDGLSPQERQLALNAALFSRPFDEDDVGALPDLDLDQRAPLYRWLTGLPFIYKSSEEDRYLYYHGAQELLSNLKYWSSRREYDATRKTLADHYENLRQKTHDDAEWLELTLAYIFQLFCLPNVASRHITAIEQVLHAYHRIGNPPQGAR